MKLTQFKGANRSKELLEYLVKEGELPRVQIGTATILKGQRLPAQSHSLHESHDEVSYVIKGSCELHADNKVLFLEEGDVIYNPRGTEHFVENSNSEFCVIFFVLVEE